jgi:hypothetical protein
MKYALLAGVVLAGIAVSGAQAAIVCNEDGDCWRTTETYVYPPAARLRIQDDNWKWAEGERYRWRQHDGRGYWQGGSWVDF